LAFESLTCSFLTRFAANVTENRHWRELFLHDLVHFASRSPNLLVATRPLSRHPCPMRLTKLVTFAICVLSGSGPLNHTFQIGTNEMRDLAPFLKQHLERTNSRSRRRRH
jgi:hypothetical protein